LGTNPFVNMKQFYPLLFLLLFTVSLTGQTVVFDTDNGGYLAYNAAGGLIGVEDYVMDVSSFGIPANTATVDQFTFVGGVTGSSDAQGGVIDIFFFDANGTFVTSVAFNFNEGTFIYDLPLGGIDLPTEGSVQLFIDDTRAENTGRSVVGQWFLSPIPAGALVGSTPGNPFNNGTDANGNELAFTMTMTASAVSLPVEFSSVNVSPLKDALELTWSTATETDNSGFEVQRSEDGIAFTNIGFVSPRGRSDNGEEYVFTDETILKNTDYYYRLRQIDFDGSSTLSEVVVGALNDDVFTVGDLFPNPATSDATFSLHLEEAQPTIVNIYDATGREVSSQTYDLNAGNHRLNIDVTHLTSGTYAQIVDF